MKKIGITGKMMCIYGFIIVGVPVVLLLITHAISYLPWHARLGSSDGWLGFFGGYLGAIITIAGIYIQIALQKNADNERIKFEQLAISRRESLENFTRILQKLDSIYHSLNAYFKIIKKSIDTSRINGNELLNLTDETKKHAINFAKNVRISYRENDIESIDNFNLEIKKVIMEFDKYKINNLTFFPFNENAKKFTNAVVLMKTIDVMLGYLKSDAVVIDIMDEVTDIFDTFQSDQNAENLVANLEMEYSDEGDNLLEVFNKINMDEDMDNLEEVIKQLKFVTDEYILNKNV